MTEKRWQRWQLLALSCCFLGVVLVGVKLANMGHLSAQLLPGPAPAGRLLQDVDLAKMKDKVYGVAGFQHEELARELGFEAFRTWGVDQLQLALENALKSGFWVMAGLDMTRDPRYYKGHEHCAADLEESKFWRSEAKRIRDIVQRTQFNRNILMWLVGNELETPIDAERGSDCLWRRVNWMAAKVKEVDASHAVGIALAGINPRKVAKVADICPQIDVLGTNIYGNDIRDVGARLREAGWTKPWAFTEVGGLGPWQVPQTSWGAPVEPSSTAKGQFLKRALQLCIDDDMCVAFMVFLWGWKWEKTATWFGLLNEWPGANAPVQGYLNDIGQPLYDMFAPIDKTSFRIHIEKFLVDSDKAVPLGFTAHRGAEVQLDLHAVATHCTGEQDAWANWFVTRETLVSPKSDGNIAEEPQTVIEHVVEACEPGSFRAKLKTSMLEEGNYRLYGFARRTQDGAILGYPSTVEASISIPFHIGKEKCADVKKGRCFDEVTRLMTSARRMGYASWPAAALLPTSSFKEFQAALHMESQADCPAPCSVEIPANASTNCSSATKLRYVVGVPAIQELLNPPKLPSPDTFVCHTARPTEECYYGTKWLMDTGRFTMPDSFPEVTAYSSWEDGQLALWKRARNGCKRPCPSLAPESLGDLLPVTGLPLPPALPPAVPVTGQVLGK